MGDWVDSVKSSAAKQNINGKDKSRFVTNGRQLDAKSSNIIFKHKSQDVKVTG